MQTAILKFLLLLLLLLAQLILLTLMSVSTASAQTRMPGMPDFNCVYRHLHTGPTHIHCALNCRCPVGASYTPAGFFRWNCPDTDYPSSKTMSQCEVEALAANPGICDDGVHLCQAAPPPPPPVTMTMTMTVEPPAMTMMATTEPPASSSSSGGGGSGGALIAGGAVLAGIVLWNAFAPELPDGAELRPSANVAYRDGFARSNFGLYAAYGDWSAVVSSSHAGQGWSKPYARIRWEWAWEF